LGTQGGERGESWRVVADAPWRVDGAALDTRFDTTTQMSFFTESACIVFTETACIVFFIEPACIVFTETACIKRCRDAPWRVRPRPNGHIYPDLKNTEKSLKKPHKNIL
jgi:hypothetical protein